MDMVPGKSRKYLKSESNFAKVRIKVKWVIICVQYWITCNAKGLGLRRGCAFEARQKLSKWCRDDVKGQLRVFLFRLVLVLPSTQCWCPARCLRIISDPGFVFKSRNMQTSSSPWTGPYRRGLFRPSRHIASFFVSRVIILLKCAAITSLSPCSFQCDNPSP